MAAGIFQELLRDKLTEGENGIEVYSAGINAVPDTTATSFARFVMEERGINLLGHKSTPISKKLIQTNDLILAMDQEIKNAILQNYPSVDGKVYTLKEFSSHPEGRGIPDPINMGLEVYYDCALYISRCLERIVEEHYLKE